MPTLPRPLETHRSEPFGGYRHTLWIALPTGADIDAAARKIDFDTASLVEFELTEDGNLMSVSVFTKGPKLTESDRAAWFGELAEAWVRATARCV
jgi:hypothetical protein